MKPSPRRKKRGIFALSLLGALQDIFKFLAFAREKKERKRGKLSDMANKSLKTQKKELKKSLMDNLDARGLVETVYRDKVNEYIDLWQRRQELKADIEDRGITVLDDKGRECENRSVSLEIQTSRQMLAIYTALGFKEIASKASYTAGEDDEL